LDFGEYIVGFKRFLQHMRKINDDNFSFAGCKFKSNPEFGCYYHSPWGDRHNNYKPKFRNVDAGFPELLAKCANITLCNTHFKIKGKLDKSFVKNLAKSQSENQNKCITKKITLGQQSTLAEIDEWFPNIR